MASFLDQVIVALDVPSLEECRIWLKRLKGQVGGVKIGLQMFTLGGPSLIEEATKLDLPVFLDLKLHDIPNTVRNAAAAAAELGVWMMTLHSQGGADMLVAAREGVEKFKSDRRPKLLAVTVLTSDDSGPAEVLKRAALAKKAGCDGVIASALEAKALRQACGGDFLIVTPGIRLDPDKKDDQKRVATPVEAINAGADYLVIGRPILNAKDPQKILETLSRLSVKKL